MYVCNVCRTHRSSKRQSLSTTGLFRTTFTWRIMFNLQSWTKVLGTVPGNIYIFLSFLGPVLKQCILFEILLRFSLPPPYTKLNLGKNSECTRPTLFVVWGEGLDLCDLENAPETQMCPKTFVHDCLKEVERKKGSFEGFSSLQKCFFGIPMEDRNWTNLFPAFPSFLNVF